VPTITTSSNLHPWFAVQVHLMRESATKKRLTLIGYETFLPVFPPSSHRYKGMKSAVPIFPGYLFCRINLHDRARTAVTTPGVVRILGNATGPIPIPESELSAVRRIADSGLPLRTQSGPTQGCDVMITEGCLKGICGTVVEGGNSHQLAIAVSQVNCSLMVKIEQSWARLLCSACRKSVGCRMLSA
jgi:transcription termination/antitermination protein NusG